MIKKNEQSHISYTFNNLDAIQAESLSPHFRDIAPMVRFAPDKFHLAGVNGQADNWKDFGKWIYDNLLAGLDRLSKETILKIQSLVRDVEDPVERARIVYKYMQDKTRYISVQIGIGGWKPMAASEVDRLGYGDCKALTNYTSSLLKAAGVPSYYTIIYANEKEICDLNLHQFRGNHAIADGTEL
ncbi:MAG: transglutaminase family protein [Flavobacteriaceae bacterium]|nr:transglutaminase family protein [Flavobacteriaceae bacterium]